VKQIRKREKLIANIRRQTDFWVVCATSAIDLPMLCFTGVARKACDVMLTVTIPTGMYVKRIRGSYKNT